MCLITGDSGRMVELLWFIGFCGEFPSQLAERIGGHPDWNRHVKYEAIKKDYVTVYREESHQRVIRSLRLTDKGLDYIGSRDPKALAYLWGKANSTNAGHGGIDKTLRLHALATALVMAYNAGAVFLPDRKPSLLRSTTPDSIKLDPRKPYYYSSQELRQAIQVQGDEESLRTVPKTARLLGVIVQGEWCYLLYHTGNSRMFWLKGVEENTVAAIQSTLLSRGINVRIFSQVIIGNRMSVAEKLMKTDRTGKSKYFTLSTDYNNCFFVTNDSRGDKLLSVIVNPSEQLKVSRRALSPFIPPPQGTRTYDALTRDRQHPVILGYTCDLLQLGTIQPYMDGFRYGPVILCYDYQADTIQSIVGPQVEIRIMEGGVTQ